MGSPKVLARATGSAAERACSTKGVIPHGDPADRPLAGAPSLLGLPQRTPLEAKPRPPTPQILRRWCRRAGIGLPQGTTHVSKRAFQFAGKPARYDSALSFAEAKVPLHRA